MIKAVVFDLDGTITRPFLDFKEMRAEMGVDQGRQSLLDLIAAMPEPRRSEANAVLTRHERMASENAEFNRGARDLLDHVAGRSLRSGILTRNSEQSTRRVIARLSIRVDGVITRDTGLPVKPDPAGILRLAEQWRIDSGEVLMVGDYLYDVEAGQRAGSLTCLVTNGQEPGYECRPDFRVEFPDEVIAIVEDLLGR
jgi:HAD superfamily hydrolase (TIGR01549 family)